MIVYVAFHTMKRGFELSVAVAAQVMQMSGGEGFIFNFLFEKFLRESSQAVAVRKNIDYHEICAVADMIECRQVAASMQWAVAEGSGFSVPERRRKRRERESSVDTSADDREPPGSPACSGYGG